MVSLGISAMCIVDLLAGFLLLLLKSITRVITARTLTRRRRNAVLPKQPNAWHTQPQQTPPPTETPTPGA